MEYFLRNVLFNSFSECAGCCFVITSRRMCIEHELRNNKIAGIHAYGICKMDDADQDMWMDLYGNLLQKNLPNHYYNISNLDDYWDYIAKLRKIREDNNIKGLLEIPILFRMIIHCRFLPITKDVNYNQVSIYESLFHETIMRHDGDETSIKNAMEHLAYAIYMDNDDSADLDDVTVGISSSHNKKHIKTSDSLKNVSIPSWIYSYYTMYSGGKKRVMFLHRSFYQYFFACYIYRCIRDINETTLSKTDLSFWGRRRISHDVFDYLNQLLDDNDKVALRNNGNAIVKILTDTDSILLSDNNHSVNNNVSIIDQAGNAFCNLVSSLSVLNALPKDAFNTTLYVSDQKYYRKPLLNCLKRYSSHGIIIKNVDVSQEIANSSPSFRDAIIINVDFNDSDYKGSVFNGAIINNDNFQKTDLRGASFMNTSINNTDFSDADLRGASFSYMAFNNCDMIGTNFRGAEFSSVTFSYNCNIHGADFRGASFINVSFEDLDLDGVDFRGTFFSYCNMADTIIKNTSFEGAILKDTALPKGFENNQE